jgi:hypothetical protein
MRMQTHTGDLNPYVSVRPLADFDDMMQCQRHSDGYQQHGRPTQKDLTSPPYLTLRYLCGCHFQSCMKQVSPGVQTVVGASSPGDAAVTVSDLHIQNRVLSLTQL